MWWSVGAYFFVGLLAAISGCDRREFGWRTDWWLTFFLWPAAITWK